MGDLGEIGKLVLDQVGKTSLTKRDNFFFESQFGLLGLIITLLNINIQQYILDVLVRSLKLYLFITFIIIHLNLN